MHLVERNFELFFLEYLLPLLDNYLILNLSFLMILVMIMLYHLDMIEHGHFVVQLVSLFKYFIIM